MRLLLLLSVFLVFFQISSIAQVYGEKLLYLKKVESFKRMQNTGITLDIIGISTTIVGISMFTSADWQKLKSPSGQSYYATEDPKALKGFLLAIAGIPITAVGTVFTIIGSRKVNFYKRKLGGFSFDYKASPFYQGVVVSYKF